MSKYRPLPSVSPEIFRFELDLDGSNEQMLAAPDTIARAIRSVDGAPDPTDLLYRGYPDLGAEDLAAARSDGTHLYTMEEWRRFRNQQRRTGEGEYALPTSYMETSDHPGIGVFDAALLQRNPKDRGDEEFYYTTHNNSPIITARLGVFVVRYV